MMPCDDMIPWLHYTWFRQVGQTLSTWMNVGFKRPKRTTRGRARSTAKQRKVARSVLKDWRCWAANTDHQSESKEHSQADEAGEVRFGGFGLLSGQNRPEQGAQPTSPSWRGPFWRIWAAERQKRTTSGSKEHRQASQAGEVRFGGFGLLSGQNIPEQGAQPTSPSWRGPSWRIWAAVRQKRTTSGSREHSQA